MYSQWSKQSSHFSLPLVSLCDTVQKRGCIPLSYMHHSFPVRRDDTVSKYYSVKTAVNKWKVSKERCQKWRTNIFFCGYLTHTLIPLLIFEMKLLFCALRKHALARKKCMCHSLKSEICCEFGSPDRVLIRRQQLREDVHSRYMCLLVSASKLNV